MYNALFNVRCGSLLLFTSALDIGKQSVLSSAEWVEEIQYISMKRTFNSTCLLGNIIYHNKEGSLLPLRIVVCKKKFYHYSQLPLSLSKVSRTFYIHCKRLIETAVRLLKGNYVVLFTNIITSLSNYLEKLIPPH